MLKVEVTTSYGYWRDLRRDRARYEAEKHLVAGTGSDSGRYTSELAILDIRSVVELRPTSPIWRPNTNSLLNYGNRMIHDAT